MTTKELKAEYLSLYQSICEVECYGRSDLLRMSKIVEELNNRGIEIVIKTEPVFIKTN